MPFFIKRAIHIVHFDFKMIRRQALLLNTDLSQLYYNILEVEPLFRQVDRQRQLMQHLLDPRTRYQTRWFLEFVLFMQLLFRIMKTQSFISKTSQN